MTNNDDNNTNTSAPLAEEEEESDCSMSMCSEEDEKSVDEDGEELDATSVYVSLFAVADRMERWYAGARASAPRTM